MARKRSGISADRAYRIKRDLETRIADIYSVAVSFMSTNDQISEDLRARVWNLPILEKAPYHVRTYLQGYAKARGDQIYRYHIAWMLWCDDRLMTSREVDALTASEKEQGKAVAPDYRSPWSRIDSDHSRHVWIDHDGTLRRDRSYDLRFREGYTQCTGIRSWGRCSQAVKLDSPHMLCHGCIRDGVVKSTTDVAKGA